MLTCKSFGAENDGNDYGVLEKLRDDLVRFLNEAASTGRRLSLDIEFPSGQALNGLDISKALESLNKKCHQGSGKELQALIQRSALPSTILFPYSRHSSYPELYHLVHAFKPRDVWPCTVHAKHWIRNGWLVLFCM
jgi:hypothetical protein